MCSSLNSAINYPGLNPGRHGEMPTTNCLKYGAALLHFITLIMFNERYETSGDMCLHYTHDISTAKIKSRIHLFIYFPEEQCNWHADEKPATNVNLTLIISTHHFKKILSVYDLVSF
jgi:hypothetical protein